MNATFKSFTIQTGGTPQPLVGTWLTQNAYPGGADPQGEKYTVITVADSSMFKQGQRGLLLAANLTNPETVTIQKVVNSTTIALRNLTSARVGGVFGTGDFLILSIPVNSAYIQTVPGNAGLLYVGTQGLVKTGLVHVVATLQNFNAGTQPIDFSDTRYASEDPMMSSDLWVDGSTGDGYLPSFGVV